MTIDVSRKSGGTSVLITIEAIATLVVTITAGRRLGYHSFVNILFAKSVCLRLRQGLRLAMRSIISLTIKETKSCSGIELIGGHYVSPTIARRRRERTTVWLRITVRQRGDGRTDDQESMETM